MHSRPIRWNRRLLQSLERGIRQHQMEKILPDSLGKLQLKQWKDQHRSFMIEGVPFSVKKSQEVATQGSIRYFLFPFKIECTEKHTSDGL